MANSKRLCTYCKKRKLKVDMIIVDAGAFCDNQCRYDYGIHRTAELQKKTAQLVKKKRAKERREFRLKDTDKQKNLTQASFNKMRRLQELLWFKERGIEPYCISCQRTNMDWCCGHLKTRGGFPELALDPKNTYLQCNYHCNRNLSGNTEGNKHSIGYKKGIVYRFGEEEGRKILNYLEQKHEPKRYRGIDYFEMRREFNKEIRRLEKILKIS